MSYNLFFLSVLVVFSLVWLCHSVLATLTWQRPQRHARFEVENISQEMFSFFFLCKQACTQFHMSDGVYVRILYMNICALMCVFVYLYLCLWDPNDAFPPLLYWAVSTVLVTVTHTGPPSKSGWDRSFFSVRREDSRWHQIDPGHVGLIILCLHMSASYGNTSRRVQKAWAKNLQHFSVLCYH